jgi:hypothetical protein
MKLRAILATATMPIAMLAATPGACTLPDWHGSKLIVANNVCRGKAVYAVPGSIWYVSLDNGDGTFLGLRFTLQFVADPARPGFVKGYYLSMGGKSPAGVSFNAFVNGKPTGSSDVELNLYPNIRTGQEIDIKARFVSLTTGAVTTGGSYRFPSVGLVYRLTP